MPTQNGVWTWPIANSPDLLILKESIPSTLMPRCEHRDSLQWRPTLSGFFSTSATWQVLRSPHPKVDWHRLVWFSGNIPKAAFMLWLAIRKRLGTQDRLLNPAPTGCLFCTSSMETHEHLFFECPFTAQVWRTILTKCYKPPPTLTWSELISWMVQNWKGKSLAITLNKLAFATTVYTIWRDQNSRFHTNSYSSVEYMVFTILNLIRGRAVSYTLIEDNEANRQLLQDWDIPDTIFS